MVCERTDDENGVAFFAGRRQDGSGDFLVLSAILSAAGAAWSLLEGDNAAAWLFLAAAAMAVCPKLKTGVMI